MQVDMEAENSTQFQTGSAVVASGDCGNSNNNVSESSKDYMSTVTNRYIVQWQGYAAMTRPRRHHVSLEDSPN